MKDAQSRRAGLHSAHACECIASGKKGLVWWLKTACVLCRARGGNASFMAAQHTTSSSSLCSVSRPLSFTGMHAPREEPGAFFEARSGLAEGELRWVGWGGARATHSLRLGREAGDQMAQAGTGVGRMTQLATRAKHFWADVVLFQVSTLLIRPSHQKNQGGRACRADLQQLAIWAGNSPPVCVGAAVSAPPWCPSSNFHIRAGIEKGPPQVKKDGIRRHPGQVIALHLLHEVRLGQLQAAGQISAEADPSPPLAALSLPAPSSLADTRLLDGGVPCRHRAAASQQGPGAPRCNGKGVGGHQLSQSGRNSRFYQVRLALCLPPLSCRLTLALPLATSPL